MQDENAPPRLSVGGFLRQILAGYSASQPGLWIIFALLGAALAIIIYLDIVGAATPERMPHGWLLSVLQLSISVLGIVAFYRAILTSDRRVWRIDLSTLRFVGGTALVMGLIAGSLVMTRLWVAVLVSGMPPGEPAAGAVRAVVLTIAAVIISILFLRTQPWLVSLAIGRRDFGLRDAWVETTGRTWMLVGGWALLVLPIILLHAAVAFAASRPAEIGSRHVLLAGAEGILIATLALATALLNSAAFRIVTNEQPKAAGAQRQP